jgi:hypothetical protein
MGSMEIVTKFHHSSFFLSNEVMRLAAYLSSRIIRR